MLYIICSFFFNAFKNLYFLYYFPIYLIFHIIANYLHYLNLLIHIFIKKRLKILKYFINTLYLLKLLNILL